MTCVSTACLAQQPSIFLADPTIFRDQGKFYLYGTGNPDGFPVFESNNLTSWTPAVHHLALTRSESFGSQGFWAPQVILFKGVYYMAYTANEQIAIAKATSPTGPFRQDSLHAISGTGKQIDPFLFFDDNGKVYLYHVKLQHGNRIFVTEMKPDLSDIIPGTEKECIAGTAGWENTANSDWPVTEGPTVLKYKNTYYLIYSANDFRNKEYAVGYATSASPTGPWKKYENNPIISRHNIGYNGTGHGDVFMDNSHHMYYVLHTHRSTEKVSPRATGMIKIKFKDVKSGPAVLVADTTSFEWLQEK
ncbi:glycoside hydrolase family 43 protein [Chitinophaga sp.]|uniref:glycoside hydrolase family 43 protein n=1 Tax=Chitinophaga sp. TaxID=1869181 RepID=UPI0031E154E8